MLTAPAPTYRGLNAAHGSHVPFYFAIKDVDFNVATSTAADWHRGGVKRSMSTSASLDSIDVTTDTDFRAGAYKDYIPGFREGSVSIDFIAKKYSGTGAPAEEAAGLKKLWEHLSDASKSVDTKGQPIIWIKYFHPVFDKEVNICLSLSSFGEEFPYDDAVSFSAEFNYKGAPLISDIPAAAVLSEEQEASAL